MNTEQHLLLLLMEEAAEVSQAASKCIRFTTSHTHKAYCNSNLELLAIEVQDFMTILTLLEAQLGYKFGRTADSDKLRRLAEMTNISRTMGVLKNESY